MEGKISAAALEIASLVLNESKLSLMDSLAIIKKSSSSPPYLSAFGRGGQATDIYVPIVQWIERRPPKPEMKVRLLLGAKNSAWWDSLPAKAGAAEGCRGQKRKIPLLSGIFWRETIFSSARKDGRNKSNRNRIFPRLIHTCSFP